ncbi:hypothetical protein CLV24_1572 [Pontibacter ummariensis]|uniref:Uncharacterized protein n=1 Tax=Pontibacter ummariensis TaxID=1610492 RepID=A0A239LYS8_9BACT|nr:hypothetical protein [Pontibacter ummariensis]PRY00205.1 hypothetical protein CLV24_1572 [Pontibacter ummariensis]SNT35028.1 hypothetical protein SAMN06296052_1572 [Pontibacter ummariensis]
MNNTVNTGDYITLAEAAARSGKSEMTIRRLSKKVYAKEHVKHDGNGLLIRSSFVNKVYSFDNKPVISVNIDDNTDNKRDNTYQSSQAEILLARLEEKDKLLTVQQQQIERLERQFNEYREEKQKELDRLHDKWSQEQEIFKRDQHLNAGKLLAQQSQEQPEEVEAKKRRWWRW